MAFIYKISNDINNKLYIGKTNNTIERRWKEHLLECKNIQHNKRPLYDAMNKHGAEHFKIEIIEECSSIDASLRERYWINYYNTFNGYGYNATLGGDGTTYILPKNIVELYHIHKSFKQVAKLTGHDPTIIKRIVVESGIQYLTHNESIKFNCSKKVNMLSLNNEFIKTWNSMTEATKWILKNRGEAPDDTKASAMSTHISAVCLGKRKTAYGYKWEYILE
jgi:predicted GIY-YIG superfamily endonuclease